MSTMFHLPTMCLQLFPSQKYSSVCRRPEMLLRFSSIVYHIRCRCNFLHENFRFIPDVMFDLVHILLCILMHSALSMECRALSHLPHSLRDARLNEKIQMITRTGQTVARKNCVAVFAQVAVRRMHCIFKYFACDFRHFLFGKLPTEL